MNQFGHQYGIQASAFYTGEMNTSFGNTVQRPGSRPCSLETPPQDFQSAPPSFRNDGGYSLYPSSQCYAKPGVLPSSDGSCVNFMERSPMASDGTENTSVSFDYQNQFNLRVPQEIPSWMSLNSSANSFYTDIYNKTLLNPVSQSVYTGSPVRYNRNTENTAFQNRGRPKPSGPLKGNRGGFRNPPNSTAPKESRVFYCEVCKVSCAGPLAFKDHENGQRHKKRLSQVEAVEKLKKEISTDSNSSLVVVNSSSSRELRCELCDVGCTGVDSYTAHISGRQHQRTLKLHKELGKPVPETDDPLVPAAVADMILPAVEKTDEASGNETDTGSNKPMKHVDLKQLAGPEHPAVGQEYIEAVIGANGKTVSFRCKLCECDFSNADARESHIRGRRHRTQYKKKVDPSFIVDPKPANQLNRKASKSKKSKRPELKANTNNLRNNGPMGGSMSNLPPVDRFASHNAKIYSAQSPNKSYENKYINFKHASLLQTALEVQAMMMAVSVCERAMKDVSNSLLRQIRLESNPSITDESGTGGTNVDEIEEKVGERLLSGVIRVGPLGKNLLLRGEHTADLVLVCSKWPTEELTTYVSSSITSFMKSLESRLEYTVTPEPSTGTITVSVSCPDPSLLNRINDPSDMNSKSTTNQEKEPSVWPVITLTVSLTSPVVVQEKEIVSEVVTENLPTIERLITNSRQIPKELCIKSLDSVDQTSWFQQISSRGPIILISRILRDFIQSNDYWIELNEFDVEVHLDYLLSLEYNMLTRSGPFAPCPGSGGGGPPPVGWLNPSPHFSGSPRHTPVVIDLFQPSKLLRRFFESMACGYITTVTKQSPDSVKYIDLSSNENVPEACRKPFHLTIGNGISKKSVRR
ncbi:unnamed protein product [Heterobilharzia americana]|nr:unnamed protein product [Heterobilharzia americana]